MEIVVLSLRVHVFCFSGNPWSKLDSVARSAPLPTAFPLRGLKKGGGSWCPAVGLYAAAEWRLPFGGTESSGGGSFMVSSNNPDDGLIPRLVQWRRAVCYLLLLYATGKAMASRGDN